MRAIITGAAGDLGRSTIERFRAAGHRVAAIARTVPENPSPDRRWFAAADLASPEQARSAVRSAVAWLGGLDAVVHLVGRFEWKLVEQSTLADWQALYAANVETTLNTIQACLPWMKEGSSIVAVGAASSRAAGAGVSAYTSAKSAVSRLTESLSYELQESQIRINTVLPAIIDTPRNRRQMPDADFTRFTSAAAIADVIEFLASPASRAINGASIPVTNAA